MKFILITGGVISGLGKGILASSTGLYLRSQGYNVTAIKIDPYLNIDAGTMNPSQHGEVFVLDDGSESDLDLGNYERFMNITLSSVNSITTGKVFKNVLEKERRGDYLGETVQVIPHVVDEIKKMIYETSKINTCADKTSNVEVCIIELGGTVGDIESQHFIEAFRQMIFENEKEDIINIHLGLILHHGEYKTKPIQNSVKTLKGLGITPDIIVCRSETPLSQDIITKVSLFTGVKNIINTHTVDNLYCVPKLLYKNSYFEYLSKHFQNFKPESSSCKFKLYDICEEISELLNLSTSFTISKNKTYTIGIIGKYVKSKDAYLSIENAITHAKLYLGMDVNLEWVDSRDVKNMFLYDGIIIPGGFGSDGVEGMISAANYARVNKIPYLGICLGFQVALVEFARNELLLQDANSEEILKCENNVIIRMEDLDQNNLGGTMRLGSKKVIFNQSSVIYDYYKKMELTQDNCVFERFRHRYEFNTKFKEQFESNGIKFVASDESNKRMSIFELENHPHFVGVQYHPEFKSRFNIPSAPFLSFLDAVKINH